MKERHDQKNVMLTELRSVSWEAFRVTASLLKILVPALILVQVLTVLGFTQVLSTYIAPLLDSVGLPSNMAIVLATTFLTNLYGGILILISMPGLELTTAQCTVLGGIMLLSHGLIVEGSVAKLSGMGFSIHVVIRMICAYGFGLIIFHYYQFFGMGTEIVELPFVDAASAKQTLAQSIALQIKSLLLICVIVFVLVAMMRFIKHSGKIESSINSILQPLLVMVGVRKDLASVLVVGMFLGLSYGGALLVQSTNDAKYSKRDVFLVLVFISLFHSVIDDTIAIYLIGADLFPILILRLVFTIAVVKLFTLSMPNGDNRCLNSIFYGR